MKYLQCETSVSVACRERIKQQSHRTAGQQSAPAVLPYQKGGDNLQCRKCVSAPVEKLCRKCLATAWAALPGSEVQAGSDTAPGHSEAPLQCLPCSLDVTSASTASRQLHQLTKSSLSPAALTCPGGIPHHTNAVDQAEQVSESHSRRTLIETTCIPVLQVRTSGWPDPTTVRSQQCRWHWHRLQLSQSTRVKRGCGKCSCDLLYVSCRA